MFGLVFPEKSYPLDPTSFAQIDPTHWVLDVTTTVGPGDAYRSLKEACLFLINGLSLPPDKALSLYIKSPGGTTPFVFCGAVHPSRPSAILSLPWPDSSDEGGDSAKIGVSVEDLAALPAVIDASFGARVERMALRVGESLFNYMQSFCRADGASLVVPMDIMDRWYKKFLDRAKRDPDYLKGFTF
ncbi:hypothetical protein QJS10_CPA06g02337 [Acorus calamus]|uniref:Hikeshi-like domain-containing protein n=1 Tax=Acorus calamus TaxID=4465 RepID=A0AAV9ELY1_ACOCL|nr:hypothetical protein QJS10_CPA06g02337 [Acorus calamus]